MRPNHAVFHHFNRLSQMESSLSEYIICWLDNKIKQENKHDVLIFVLVVFYFPVRLALMLYYRFTTAFNAILVQTNIALPDVPLCTKLDIRFPITSYFNPNPS